MTTHQTSVVPSARYGRHSAYLVPIAMIALALSACATHAEKAEDGVARAAVTAPAQSPLPTQTPPLAAPGPTLRQATPAENMPSRVATASGGRAEVSRTTAEDAKKSLFLGTGELFAPPRTRPQFEPGDIRLNFENTDVREVVRSILGDTLQETYFIDPAVQGAVTLRTYKGINRGELLPVLEIILRQANAILVRDGNFWRVQPSAAGVRGAGRPGVIGRPVNAGYGLTFYPLRYIGVNEMMRLLDAIVKDPVGQGGAGGSVRPEPLRNMLVIAGTPRETQYIIDTIEMFDVDWMSGMSAGLFTLEHSEAKKVLEEVDKVLGGLGAGVAPAAGGNLGPLFGLVRVQLIERLNAILVLSPRAEMIEQAEKWIRRLDRGGAADSSRLYVYPLQYTSAEKLAPVLQQAMQGRSASTSTVPTAQTAPGQSPLNIATPVAVPTNPTSPTGAQATPQAPARVQPASAQGASGGQGSALARNATIIADKDRNALLIVASPAEYSAIEAALKKLDVLPRQVMVEVTVLSVDLTDEFEFGVSWAASRNSNVGTDQFNRWSGSTGAITANGFALELANRDLAGKILNVLNAKLTANDGSKRARVHASPKLMAVDNTPVTFNVGRSVSVQTSTTSVPGTTNNSVTNNYQYLQTGISVSITPRISAGGTVSLEITQEISDTLGFREGNPNPDLSKTALKNSVLAQDGETIVMAGLIQNKTDSGSGGLPGVSRIPLLGGLFGSQSLNNIRSETLVLVRPIVVTSLEQSREANDEIRNKMHLLKESFSEVLLPTQKDKNPNVGAVSPQAPTVDQGRKVDPLMPSMRLSGTSERPIDPAPAKP